MSRVYMYKMGQRQNVESFERSIVVSSRFPGFFYNKINGKLGHSSPFKLTKLNVFDQSSF